MGRSRDCDIPLADGNVSRRHAELDVTGRDPRLRKEHLEGGRLAESRVSRHEHDPALRLHLAQVVPSELE